MTVSAAHAALLPLTLSLACTPPSGSIGETLTTGSTSDDSSNAANPAPTTTATNATTDDPATTTGGSTSDASGTTGPARPDTSTSTTTTDTSTTTTAMTTDTSTAGDTTTVGPVCGDDVIDVGELCDDGNVLDGDGCSAACQPERAPSMCPPGTIASLVNEGFETGTLTPWQTNGPQMVTLTGESHSGAWAAEIDGNFYISQSFDPVPIGTLVTADLWAWHPPNGGGMAVYLVYADDEVEAFDYKNQDELEGWRHFDFLADLDPAQSLAGITAFGYGPPNNENITRFDDLRICRKP